MTNPSDPLDVSFATPVDTSVPLALIIDDVTTADITYFCSAIPGSKTSKPLWKIYIFDETLGYLVVKWADGNDNFDNVADDRDSLSYS